MFRTSISTAILLVLLSAFAAAQNGPPAGFSVAVPIPSSVGESGTFGFYTDLVLDSAGDPAVAYEWYDPAGKGNADSSAIYFVRWSRTQNKWTAPVQVAVVGENRLTGGSGSQLSLAYDASNNTFGIAYVVQDLARIDLALSIDGGQTWKIQAVASNPAALVAGPQLALGAGRVHFAYLDSSVGIRYRTGAQSAVPSSWTSRDVPSIADMERLPFSLKLDSAGNPGIAFWMFPATAYNSILGFWRPTFQTTIKAGDSAELQNDDIGAALTFVGTNPRITAFVYRGEDFSYTWATSSNDGGLSWTSLANIPNDGGQYQGGNISTAAGSKGQGALVGELLGGNGSTTCGYPKLARSADFLSWTTCSPGGGTGPRVNAGYPRVAFDSTDHLYIAFQNTDPEDVSAGIVVWREPTAVTTTPQIATGGIVNAASFQPTLCPGTLATIFGSNFISPALSAASVPLATNLGGVTVSINGRLAPLVYAGANQINFQVPYETAVGSATVIVSVSGFASPAAQVTVAPSSPGIFVYNGSFSVIQNQDYSVNGPGNTAQTGSYVTLYTTGLGSVSPAVASGSAAPLSPLSSTTLKASVTVNNVDAFVLFAGLTPQFVGLFQINFQVPDLPSGVYPVQVTAGTAKSNAPTISVTK